MYSCKIGKNPLIIEKIVVRSLRTKSSVDLESGVNVILFASSSRATKKDWT